MTRVWQCEAGHGITQQYAAAKRLGPYAPPTRASEYVEHLPGYVWTGQFYERIGGTPPAPARPASRAVPGVPWVRVALWFGVAWLVLRLL